jgi:hypothetical protein
MKNYLKAHPTVDRFVKKFNLKIRPIMVRKKNGKRIMKFTISIKDKPQNLDEFPGITTTGTVYSYDENELFL